MRGLQENNHAASCRGVQSDEHAEILRPGDAIRIVYLRQDHDASEFPQSYSIGDSPGFLRGLRLVRAINTRRRPDAEEIRLSRNSEDRKTQTNNLKHVPQGR